MRKSAIFILIFTAIVLAVFYSYNNKSSQGKASSNSYPTPFQNNKPANSVTAATAKPATTETSIATASPTAVATAAPSSNNGKMTMSDVSSHNKRNDCYLVIKNNVYDVSSYISNHPGGQGKIISNCGQEVTGIFADIHSNFAWDLLKNYKIGQL